MVQKEEQLLSSVRKIERGRGTYSKCSIIRRLSHLLFQVLIIAKSIAVGLSGSLVVISSLVDSGVDLISGVIIWYTSKAMKQIDIYNYPIGQCVNLNYPIGHCVIFTFNNLCIFNSLAPHLIFCCFYTLVSSIIISLNRLSFEIS